MNGRRAGNACSDCYLGPTSSELELYVACLLLVASERPQSQHLSWFVGQTRVPTVSPYGKPTTSRPWSETVGSAETSKKPAWKGSEVSRLEAVMPPFATFEQSRIPRWWRSLAAATQSVERCYRPLALLWWTLRLRARYRCLCFCLSQNFTIPLAK